jgi:hypothetical protein
MRNLEDAIKLLPTDGKMALNNESQQLHDAYGKLPE